MIQSVQKTQIHLFNTQARKKLHAKKSTESEILLKNWNYQADFPELPDDLIQRPHLLSTIKDILSSATPVVFLEGEEGDGATTTLAQFCIENESQSFSLFIKPASRFAYSPDYLMRVLAEQFSWYLSKTALNRDHLSQSDFNTLVQRVRGRARSSPVYFLIDGLHQIPKEDSRAINQITQDVLPLGVNNFRFIITGQQEEFNSVTKRIKSKPYQQLRFRPEETQSYFKSLEISSEDALEIHSLCKGIPGRLASVRRLLTLGSTIDSIRDAEPAKFPEFVKMEFESIGRLSEPQKEFLAAITFAKRHLSIAEATEVAKLSPEVATQVLIACPFLTSSQISGRIEFVSESHRKYAERQLDGLKKNALGRQIDHLISNPKSEAALRFLPAYYEALNKQDEIIQLISREHYINLFNQTQSIGALRNRAELGAKSANSLKRTTDAFKFALQKSIFSAVGAVEISETEIEAAVSLGKTNTALVLANQASSKEDRLALLSRYARRLKEKNGTVQKELIDYIKDVAKDLEFSSMGSEAVEIAADIILFDPDLAISIVESAEINSHEGKSKDAAYMHLSISASLSRIQHKTQTEDKAKTKISNESLRKLATSFEVLSTTLDVSESIKIIETMEPNNRLYFLKSLIKSRHDGEKILNLVEYGLELVVRETAYTPKSSDLADLAIPLLRKCSEHERLKILVSRFDAQMGLLAKTAFSKDMVRLQLRLAGAEVQFDPDACRRRLNECYYEIASIKTAEIQLECCAIFLGIIKVIDKTETLEKLDGFRGIMRAEISDLLDSILKNTGNHIAALSGVLDILIDDDPNAALQLAKRLNTETRRTEVFARIAKIVSGKPYSDANNDVITDSLQSINDKILRANAANAVTQEISNGKHADKWLGKIDLTDGILLRPQYICAYEISRIKAKFEKSSETELNEFQKRFDSLTQNFNSSIDLISAHFHASEALAKFNSERALDFYKTGISLKSQSEPASEGALNVLATCISLICRSFSPLMRKNELNEDTINRLFYIVDALPCLVTKSQVYAELSERAWSANRLDLCKRIVVEKCNPILNEINLKSRFCYNVALHAAFPAQSGIHLESALIALGDLDTAWSDSAIYNACMMRLRKLPTADPYYDDAFDFSKVEREDILDVIALAAKIQEDSMIYAVINHLVDAVCDKTNKLKFTAQQKIDFSQRCEVIINHALPDKKNIQHDGFKIAALSQIYRLQDVPFSKWELLESSAEKIDNFADQGYVFLVIAGAMPARFDSHRQRHLNTALSLFEKIPSSLDRLGRFRSYAKETWKSSLISAKETLKKAMLISIDLGADDRVDNNRREIIELADQINPDLAKELIELIDDDPARRHMKLELKKAASASKAKREMANGKKISDIGKVSSDEISEGAWKNTAGLLAGKIETKSLAIMTEYVTQASKESIQDAHGMLCWYLENSAKKYISEADIVHHITPITEALLLSTEIASTIISRARTHSSNFIEDDDSNEGSLLLSPGTRSSALELITRWLRNYGTDLIKISDPYFGPDDIGLLRLILAECSNAKVCILTSKRNLGEKDNLSDTPFLQQWRLQVDQDPPETDIIAMAYENGNKSVIHDRWIISGNHGLRLGTSFNALGNGKISEISEMEEGQARECGDMLDKFIRRPKVVDGERISYVVFSL